MDAHGFVDTRPATARRERSTTSARSSSSREASCWCAGALEVDVVKGHLRGVGVGEFRGPFPTRLVRAGMNDIGGRFEIVDLPPGDYDVQFQRVATTSPEPHVGDWFDGEFWRVHAETVYVSGASLVAVIVAQPAPVGVVAPE